MQKLLSCQWRSAGQGCVGGYVQRVIVLALMVFLANYRVLYSVLPAAVFVDDPNPLLMLRCEVRPDGNVLPQAGGAQLYGSFLSLVGKLS